ncbi:MAG TPA: serine/threonine-protein kinase [Vicinamibacteria bacterium]|nr:serine/threonine-protein kinase [Vicinamibacteria bacterium]
MLPDQAGLRSRRRIGRYRVISRIGRGGMGMVYRCLDETLEREVAVKTLTLEGSLDEESRKRFEVEAKAAAKLQHPNIVTVFELGADRGMSFIAMELLPGVDLEALLRSGETLLLPEQLNIVIQVCRGLAYAHEHRIIHRDIKPSNIRLLDDGTAKIMDFGIAKLGGTQLTKAGMMVGTVHYMSPEQVRGKPLDGRSDVFSLGVILYELLAGRRPFTGEGATEVLYKIVHDPPPPLNTEIGGLTPRLQEVLDRALAKDPDRRYPSAGGLADDLADVLESYSRTLRGVPRSGDAQEAVKAARRLLKEGGVDESLRRLRELKEESPHSVEVRRALRTANRDLQRRAHPPAPEPDDFPELDTTFHAPATRRAPETLLPPTTVQPAEVPPPGGKGRGLLWGALLGVAVTAAVVLALVASRSPSAAVHIPVRSQPVGAAVLLDGKETGVQTNGELVLSPPLPPRLVLTFRKEGHKDEVRTVKLPLPAGEAVSVALAAASVALPVMSDPPGAFVALDGQRLAGTTPIDVPFDPSLEHRLNIVLDGYAPQEVRLIPGQVPTDVRTKLEPVGPLGTVTVASTYPLDVLWRGKPLAREQVAPRVSLPAGRQVLTLVSSPYFLRTDVAVTVGAGGQAVVEAPGLGKISIRANPDNCQVFIDGAFVDYPPILDKAAAAGVHAVSFRWADGTKRQETAEVVPGGAAFVTGRKE